jgi:hypothetical protein
MNQTSNEPESTPVALSSDALVSTFNTHLILPLRLKGAKTLEPPCEHPNEFLQASQLLAHSGLWRKFDVLDVSTAGVTAQEQRQEKKKIYQSFHYFHPFVRRFWFDSSKVRHFRRSDITAMEVGLSGRKNQGIKLSFKVGLCEVILFQPDIALLHLALNLETMQPLHVVQDCLDQIRRIYPPYFDVHIDATTKSPERWGGGHFLRSLTIVGLKDSLNGGDATYEVPDSNFEPLDASLNDFFEKQKNAGMEASNTPLIRPWQLLLSPFFLDEDSCGVRVSALGDDRAALCSFVGFQDRQSLKRVSDGDWMRLAFADESGNDRLPQSEAFSQSFERKYCYDRFWYKNLALPIESGDAPSRMLNCGFAFAWAGASDDLSYFGNTEHGAPAIFEACYVPMALIAHFQKAALLTASARLSELSTRDRKKGYVESPDAQRFSTFYLEFISFTQCFWFDEISPQAQGIEMFAQWHERLGITALYNEVRQELQDIVALNQQSASLSLAEESKVHASNATSLTKVATAIAVPALIISLISMFASILGLDLFKAEEKEKGKEFARQIPEFLGKVSWPTELFHNVLLIAGLLALVAMVCLAWTQRDFLNRTLFSGFKK